MSAARSDVRVCDNCRAEFDGKPVERDDGRFCCDGCAEGGPCTC